MSNRLMRIEDEMQTKLSLIVRKMNDPRIPSLMSFTRVKISPDLSIAKIYVSVVDMNANREEVVSTLNKARGFLKTKISKVIKLRKIPNFLFILDDSAEYAFKINKILSQI